MALDNTNPPMTRRSINVKRNTVKAASTTATASPATARPAEAVRASAEIVGSRAVINERSEVRNVY